MKVFSLALRASVAALCIGAAYAATRSRTAAAAQTDMDPTVIRSRYMAIDVHALPGPSDRRRLREPAVTLQLFPDVTIVGEFDRYDPNPAGMTWVGHVEGVPASFITLVYSGGLMAGSIITPDALYQIRPAAARAGSSDAALHVVSEIEQAAFLREAPPIDVRFSDADRAAAAQTPMTDTAGVIDVMVLYTALAAANAGGSAGITNLINLGVSETNTSYANSGVAQRIRLVYSAQVPYAEVSGFSTNLTNLRNGSGALSGVAALRETHHADLVSLLVHPTAPDACGIAFLMTSVTSAFASSAFSVADTTCVSPNYSFAHELGHNMGARHDWFVDNATTPFTYAHGHVNAASTQRWRTIMAYPDQCTAQGFTCTRLLFWANPQTKYLGFCGRGTNCDGLQYWFFPGVPMGIAAGTSASCQSGNTSTTNCDADDSRTLNDSALTVANFRQGSQPG
jgi:hypothetical protein